MKRIVCGIMAVCLLFSCALAGTWTCGICGFENEADNLFCGTCGAERSGWICDFCGVLNDEDAAFCKGCGFSRNKESIWVCSQCGTFNDGKYCKECGRGAGGAAISGNEIAGDIITFGFYGDQNIEWQVLENDGSSLYLLSRYGLEAKPYNEQAGEVRWINSTLRAWLNNDFYSMAFNEDERGRLLSMPEHSLLSDYVSLLSVSDVRKYFNVNGRMNEYSERLVCMPTPNAVANGTWTMKEENINEWQERYDYKLQIGTCWWWLRYTAGSRASAPTVGSCGDVSYSGGEVYHASGCVRPFIRVSY